MKKNQIVEIVELGDKVQAEDDENIYEFDYGAYHRIFILGYCITYHKSQGSTIRNNVNIFDIDFVEYKGEKKPLYTAWAHMAHSLDTSKLHLRQYNMFPVTS